MNDRLHLTEVDFCIVSKFNYVADYQYWKDLENAMTA